MNYNISLPQNTSDSYDQNDTVVFQLGKQLGESIVSGTVRLSGKIKISVDDTDIDEQTAARCPQIGLNSVLQYVNTNFASVGTVENINDYSQLYSLHFAANNDTNSIMTSSDNVASACVANSGFKLSTYTPGLDNTDQYLPFSLRPHFVLNNINGNLPFDKTGDIEVTIRFSDYYTVAFNNSAGVLPITYTIDGPSLKLTYMTSPTQKEELENPVQYRYYSYSKSVITGSNYNISTTNPAVCEAVAGSIIKSSNLVAVDKNKCMSVYPPSVSRVEFIINNGISNILNFPLLELSEISRNAWLSMSKQRNKSLLSSVLAPDETGQAVANSLVGFIGLNFGQLVDMRQKNFIINIRSGIAEDHNLFLFYRNVAEI